MPVKYQCPKCERRYVEWGAEKFGFKCPHCVNEELVRLGAIEQTSSRQSNLKRRLRRPTPQPVAVEEEEMLEPVELASADTLEEEEEPEEEEVQVGVGAAPVVASEEDVDAETDTAADEELVESGEDLEIGDEFGEEAGGDVPEDVELDEH
ncbi:MAG: hypothetical protein KA184_09615 [Candidatus Hydrogenedentes bacterium]|nr:hypothetical protein [Candidatus Hydrogenedentota bacterium]